MAQNPGYSTNTGISAIPEIPSDKYPEVYVDNLKLRNGIKVLQGAIDTYTGALGEDQAYWSAVSSVSRHMVKNLTRIYAKAGEAITAGAMVNFYDIGSGVIGARNASAAAAGKPARAWSTTTIAAGEFGEFIEGGVSTLVSGLTVGTTYYLSNTAGLISAAPGTVSQKVGYALGTSLLSFRPEL